MHQSSERKINCLWDNRTRKLAFWPFDRLMESCTFWSGIYLHTFDAEFQMKCLRRMKCIWQRNLFETFQRGEPGGHKNSLTIYAKNNLCIKCVFNLASILLEWRTVVAPEQESDSFCASIYCGFPIMPTWYFFYQKETFVLVLIAYVQSIFQNTFTKYSSEDICRLCWSCVCCR